MIVRMSTYALGALATTGFPGHASRRLLPLGRLGRHAWQDGLGLGFLQQDDVGIGMPAEDAEFFPVRRPVKREDSLGIEMRDLMSGTAVGGLNPHVIHTILGNRVGYVPSVCGELHAFGDS